MMIHPPFASVPEMIAVHAINKPGAVACQEGDRAWSWRELDALVNEAAWRLTQQGVRPGDPVAYLVEGSAWAWIEIFGALRAGATIVPLSPLLHPNVIASMIADSRSRLLFVSGSYLAIARQAVSIAGAVGTTIVPDNQADLTPPASAHNVQVDVEPDMRFNIIYSSGTTGRPKGIVHTHRARAHAAALFASSYRAAADTRLLLTIPPHSNGAWIMVLPTLYVGGTIIVERFNPIAGYLERIREARPTMTIAVPTMIKALLSEPAARDVDWSCFDLILSGGAPLPRGDKIGFRRMTGNRLAELWGLTEGFTTIIQPHQMGEHLESVGRPSPETDLRLIDAHGKEVRAGAGVEGEIVGRSTWQMSGYHQREEETQALLWRAEDGREYLRSGDIGRRDADGWLEIRGRIKDMLISGGFNVYPVDIENELTNHPAVVDCAVVGMEHIKWGEVPVAFVVLDENSDASPDDIRVWANERLSKPQRLDCVFAVSALPRNTLGKVLKHELIDTHLKRGDGND